MEKLFINSVGILSREPNANPFVIDNSFNSFDEINEFAANSGVKLGEPVEKTTDTGIKYLDIVLFDKEGKQVGLIEVVKAISLDGPR